MKAAILSLVCAVGVHAGLNEEGQPGVRQTYSAVSLGHLFLGASLSGQIIDDNQMVDQASIYRDGDQQYLRDFLLVNSSVGLSLGLGAYGQVGLALPLYTEQYKTPDFSRDEPVVPGDLKVRLMSGLPMAGQSIFHLGLVVGGSIPLGRADEGVFPRMLEVYTDDPTDFDEGSGPFGTGRASFMATLAATWDFSRSTKSDVQWHVNLGMRKPNLTNDPPFDNIAVASTALEVGINRYLALFSELHHESRFDAIGTDDWLETEPTVLTLGATVRTPVGVNIQGGFSTGLMDRTALSVAYTDPDRGGRNSFSVKTAPDFSMYFNLAWSGPLTSQDADGDGLKDDVDRCPRQPEDKDGFQDDDGCADSDNDKDGVEDKKDKCPLQGEDLDGFQDQDGCPDPDNDGDGIPDASDKCPMDAMGADGKDGCPNTDKDGDGIKDGDDKCPLGAEDKDGFEDEDGCPELDNDRDGIADADDKCPNAPETVNQFEDEDGCPDKIQVKEVVKTMVLKGVNFRTGSAELTPESFSVLDGVAQQLIDAPKTVFEVSGHTDSRGSASKNQALSRDRAQTVADYFVSKGIEPKRLRVVGYGSARPVATNNTAEGRAMNRRVELNRVD